MRAGAQERRAWGEGAARVPRPRGGDWCWWARLTTAVSAHSIRRRARSSGSRSSRPSATPTRSPTKRGTGSSSWRSSRPIRSWSSPCRKPYSATRPGVLVDRRRPVRVEAFDRLQSPGLALLAVGFCPDDRRPVRCEHEPRAGAVDLDAIAARLVDVQKEGLLDGVLVRARLDVHAVLEEDVGRPKDVLPGIHRIREMVESAAGAVVIGGERKVVALVGRRHPRARFIAAVEDDHFRGPHAENVLEEEPHAADGGPQQIG